MNISLKELARAREQIGFLGYEFLTWLFLLFNREDAKDTIALITKPVMKSDVSLVLGTRLISGLFNNPQEKIVIESLLLEESHEIFASLKNGHVIEALSISIGFHDVNVTFMINANDFSFTQIKLKNNFLATVLEKDDEALSDEDKTREEFFLRTAMLEDIERIMDAFFDHFLLLRLPGRYPEVLTDMRRQIDHRLNQFLESRKRDGGDVTMSMLKIL